MLPSSSVCSDLQITCGANDLEDVSLTDGQDKLIYTINGQYPGPSIVVYQGQQVEVVVKNKLLSEGVTIHWHGLTQKGTPWMDGVGSLSHCPINPEETFVYSFVADPVGTHWYHSHHGAQRSEGLAGALIVLDRKEYGEEEADQSQQTEYIMFLQDWFHRSSTELNKFLAWGMLQFLRGFDQDQCFAPYFGADQENVGFIPFESVLINGKGNRFLTSMMKESLPWTVETFSVIVNGTYRFRVINAAMTYSLQVSVDQHEIEVVSVDGNGVVGVRGDAVIINGGERFDMLVRTDKQVSSYWIRVTTLADGGQNKTMAILRYEGSDSILPVTEGMACDASRRCLVVNCMFGQYPDDHFTDCVSLGDMKSTPEEIKQHPVSIEQSADAFQEIFLNFHYTRGSPNPFPTSVNGKRFVRPSVPLQLLPQGNGTHIACDAVECRDLCDCTNIVKLGINNTIQLVLLNMDTSRAGLSHGIHIHGHQVHVLKVGYPKYDNSTGRITEQNADILCDTPVCNNASWQNSSWAGGNLPEANLVNPALKDTVLLPRQGYVVVRFKAENPGFWFVHCHMEPHQISGMSLILQEGDGEQMPTPPSTLPGCNNFFSTDDSTDLPKATSLLGNVMSPDLGQVTDSKSCATRSRAYWQYFKTTKAGYIAGICVLCVLNTVTIGVLYIAVKYTTVKVGNNDTTKRHRRIEINERTEPEAFVSPRNRREKNLYTPL
ncbi:L-ascorbate oxidase-like isoform X2 [Pecten maximus]|uniref:L-ascorbate oxidase-like isoform X2 n=1 Tax=Pecten maximus TaxID=6579 RepID=UPI0014585D61|nr:L-ascorbate oxidase-like isoform X2 [Pecten maximus]